MSAGVSVSVSERLAEARAVLGGQRSGIGSVWDGRTTRRDRRLLVVMARGQAMGRVLDASWSDLPADLRSDIVAAVGRWAGWARDLGLTP